MNKLVLLAALGTLAGSASAQAPAIDEVRITRPVAEINLPAEKRNVWVDEFDEIKGTYYLSNGKTMQLWMWGNRMYAKIDGMPKSQLVAASPFEFVALDQQLSIKIDATAASGRNEAQLVMLVPRMAGTTVIKELTRLVASR